VAAHAGHAALQHNWKQVGGMRREGEGEGGRDGGAGGGGGSVFSGSMSRARRIAAQLEAGGRHVCSKRGGGVR
jgi:hypothetical protein